MGLATHREVQIINPLHYHQWDDLVLSTKGYSFFHSAGWCRVLTDTYKYTPLYFALIDNDKLSTLMPLMEIDSLLTGLRGVSLPFSDYCEPIINEHTRPQAVIDRVISYGESAGWKYIDFRDGKLFQDLPASKTYYVHVLDLAQNEEQLFSGFRGSTKRNIKKATRHGIKVEICHSLRSVVEFYKLNCLTRKKHGLPPQPFKFFKKIHAHLISNNMGFVVLASYKNKRVAGAVYFYYGEKAIYKYGASNTSYQHLRANNLVMWEAIKWFSENRYKTLSLGRTDPENTGLRQFKNGWGAKEEVLRYHKYDLLKKHFVADTNSMCGFYNKVFSRMPIALLKAAGNLLYRHIG